MLNDKKLFLTKLIDFSENNCKPKYLSDGLNEKMISDYEVRLYLYKVTLYCFH